MYHFSRTRGRAKKLSPTKILFFKHLCWITRSTFSSFFGHSAIWRLTTKMNRKQSRRIIAVTYIFVSRGSDILFLVFSMLTTVFTHSPSLCVHTFGTQCYSVFTCTFTNFVWIHTRLCHCLFVDRDTTEICRMNIRFSVSANTNKKRKNWNKNSMTWARCGKWWRKKATEMKWFHISRLNCIQLESHILCHCV